MTIEDRYILDVADLRTIRLECKGCGAAISYDASRAVDPTTRCAACGVQWLIQGSDEHQMLTRLLLGLRSVAATDTKDTTGYRLRFELSRPR